MFSIFRFNKNNFYGRFLTFSQKESPEKKIFLPLFLKILKLGKQNLLSMKKTHR
jgi:hypothetical protein